MKLRSNLYLMVAGALAAAAELRPDIALIDIGLPDVDGYEGLKQVMAGLA